MSGLAWLNDLMLWLGRWFPRLVLVKPTHAGVWFGPGGRSKQVGPGLHWYWPLTSELTVVSQRLRSCEIAAQLQGQEAISLAVFYSITDPLSMVLRQNDIFAMLDDRAQACLCSAYGGDRTNSAIAESIREDLAADFSSCGVAIQGVRILQRGRVIAIKKIGDWAQHSKAEL